jgi:hypothetical protein
MSISLDQGVLGGVSDRAAVALDLEDDEVELQAWEGGGQAGASLRLLARNIIVPKGGTDSSPDEITTFSKRVRSFARLTFYMIARSFSTCETD